MAQVDGYHPAKIQLFKLAITLFIPVVLGSLWIQFGPRLWAWWKVYWPAWRQRMKDDDYDEDARWW